MKTEIIEKTKAQPRLPEVGEPWRHKGEPRVFIRIDDQEGCNGLQHKPADINTYFYSIDNNGRIVFTSRNYLSHIQILRPVSGVMRFEPVEE